MPKFKKITIEKNGNVVGEEDKSVWLDITENNLLYLSWKGGRIYFFVNKLNTQTTIKNFNFDNTTGIISFTYEGPWEDFQTGTDVQVNDLWKIQLKQQKDIKKVNKILQMP